MGGAKTHEKQIECSPRYMPFSSWQTWFTYIEEGTFVTFLPCIYGVTLGLSRQPASQRFQYIEGTRVALRILLADRNIATQNIGMKILVAAGHDVVTVSNGPAAIRSIGECAPEVLLLDVYLPGYGGIEICERVKAKPDIATVSVLLTFGRMEPFSAAECTKAKADGFITKPFEAGKLIAAIEQLKGSGHPAESAISRRPEVEKLGGQPASRGGAAKLQVSDAAIETSESVGQSAARLRLTTAPTAQESTVTASAVIPARASLQQQGGERCDVCGYVNQEHAFVCQKCDVPLPSSVVSFRCT